MRAIHQVLVPCNWKYIIVDENGVPFCLVCIKEVNTHSPRDLNKSLNLNKRLKIAFAALSMIS
jgi:hypothetical protein